MDRSVSRAKNTATTCEDDSKAEIDDKTQELVREMLARNGISHGDLVGDALADWVIDAGPAHFGYRWLFEADLVAALHLQGRGARLGSADLR